MLEVQASVRVGFPFLVQDLVKKFTRVFPRSSHLEDRFDQRTGAKLPEQVEVVDDYGGPKYVFQGVTYEDKCEMLIALADALNCNCQMYGDEYKDYVVFFPLNQAEMEEKADPQKGVSGGLSLRMVETLGQALAPIKANFERLGIEYPVPQVVPVWDANE